MPIKHIPEYPRPQFVRGEWENLNGTWQFAFDDQREGEACRWFEQFPAQHSIVVPFSYETPKSGIGDESVHSVVWYSRSLPDAPKDGKRAVLTFEGSDYFTKVWVNGCMVGTHLGGYTRFSFDITDYLTAGANTLTVRVEDSQDQMQPRGKQRWRDENFACWYVQTTGIWKTVWLEYRAQTHLEQVKMTPRLAEKALQVEWQVASRHYGGELTLTAEISFEGKLIGRTVLPVMERRGSAVLSVASGSVSEWMLRKWSPETPDLYDIRFTLTEKGTVTDTVDSYFGMREIRTENGRVMLNGAPLYQRLILDQGYWKESHLTPPDEDAIIRDVESILKMGYNGARKHQKIEDERYAYWCDVKGLLMWCEMPSAYVYGDDAVQMFTREWMDVVRQHYNHPSIITWTPFNESWGVSAVRTNRTQQQFTEAIYNLTKSLDPTRPVIVNDGWEHTVSDILTLHDYEELGAVLYKRYTENKEEILAGSVFHNRDTPAVAKGYAYRGQPILLSEYGGAAFSGGQSGAWGYGNTVETGEQFLARMEDITTAVKRIPWICGYCYTQVSDVQQEINGLMDMERRFKVDADKIRAVNLKEVEETDSIYRE